MRTSLIQTNFTSGELSRRIALGRMDIAKYNNGIEIGENVTLTVQGGALRRPGSRFIAEVKGSQIAELIGFVYNRSQAYVIEAGANYMRFYRNRVRLGAPYELTTMYSTSQINEATYVQRADTAFFGHSSVYPQRLQRFGDTSWKIENTPFITEPFDEVGTSPAIAMTLGSAAVGSTSATAASAFWLAADVGRQFTAGAGVATVTAVGSSTVATINITSPFAGTAIAASAWTLNGSPNTTLTPSAAGVVDAVISLGLGAAGWRAEDVGKYVSVNSGLAKITGFTSATSVTAIVLTEITSAVAAPPSSWTLQANTWNAVRGYPRAVTINKQRLYYANIIAAPQTIWGSEIRGYLSFRIGTEDDQAFAFELDGANNSPIMHLSPLRKMAVLTESDAMSLTGGQEKPITPTNIDKNDEPSAGANYVKPIKIGNELLFVSAEGKKLYGMGYRYEVDGFGTADRTIFASHITQSGIKKLSFEKEDSSLFALRNDGVMAVCAYDVEQEVIGWGRWLTQGQYESMATIPTLTSEDTYTIVSRTVGGVTKRYIEVFDRDMYVDCGVSGTDAIGKKVWTGFDHLEGMTVQVRADGSYAGEQVVTGGKVTLDRDAKEMQAGLGFNPKVKLLQPELGSQGTTSQGNAMTVASVIVRVLDTQAVRVNGNKIETRKFDTPVLDMEPPTVSGDLYSFTLSDSVYLTNQTIDCPYPMPFHLLNVIRKMTVND